ncbi:linker histone H1 and H5 family-domain-containing protein [Syncephalastrum racemosum]|uniref:Histone H1 n=1 Tax=Syncephalastrum racemosum TaxID=13706 RepID=A0A1X2HVY3_SYNRA|nr:linker histone H1 and H5 family-domain-containing protein [Syncephalastrum racemosum]
MTRNVDSAKTSTSTKSKGEHPPYETMIRNAILALKERKGSSRQAIKKYILANNKVSQGTHFDSQINAAIKRGHGKGIFQLPKGLSGTVKLAKPVKEKKATGEKKKAAPTKKSTSPSTTTAKKAAPSKATTKKKAPAAPRKRAATAAAKKKTATKKTDAPKKATASRGRKAAASATSA